MKIKHWGARAGKKVMAPVLTMYYCLKDKKTPVRSKIIIAGALAYFILPADLIADITPLVGFTDDLSVIFTAYEAIKKHITPEHSAKARKQLDQVIKA